MITHRAVVTQADHTGIYIAIPARGDEEHGPLEVLTDEPGIAAKYSVGDRVLVQQIGNVAEDLIVLGHTTRSNGTGSGYAPLPAVTPADNNKVLQVVSGSWTPSRGLHDRQELLDGRQTTLDNRQNTFAADQALQDVQINQLFSDGEDLFNEIAARALIDHTHTASQIVSGVLLDARIPSLAASKVTSGVFAAARIPSLPASQITTGTFGQALIPTLPQDRIDGLPAALNGKAATGHQHVIGDVVSLQTALDGKSFIGHQHSVDDVVSGRFSINRLPFIIAVGTVSFSALAANASESVAVTFPANRFISTPSVFFGLFASSPRLLVSASGTTTSGFTANALNPTTASTGAQNVRWFAIQEV